jgi:hypothetical protein
MNRLPLAIICLAALAGTACQSIPRARADLPRVEVEVAVTIDGTFADSLDPIDADFEKDIVSAVLAKSDVGLRFYPVLTERYAGDDTHPPYLMTIDIRDLHITVSEETETQGEDDAATARTHRWVSRIELTAMTGLHKRRDNAPPLTVASHEGVYTSSVQRPPAGRAVADGVAIKEPGAGAADPTPAAAAEASGPGDGEPVMVEPVMVAQSRIIAAVDMAFEHALRRMIVAIDRELALQAKNEPATRG